MWVAKFFLKLTSETWLLVVDADFASGLPEKGMLSSEPAKPLSVRYSHAVTLIYTI